MTKIGTPELQLIRQAFLGNLGGHKMPWCLQFTRTLSRHTVAFLGVAV